MNDDADDDNNEEIQGQEEDELIQEVVAELSTLEEMDDLVPGVDEDIPKDQHLIKHMQQGNLKHL